MLLHPDVAHKVIRGRVGRIEPQSLHELLQGVIILLPLPLEMAKKHTHVNGVRSTGDGRLVLLNGAGCLLLFLQDRALNT